MPWAAKTPCCEVGCPKLVAVPGYCDEHRHARQKAYSAGRRARNDPAERFYSTAEWQKARAAQLRSEPLCRVCAAAGRLTAASVVDHVVPVKQGGAIWDSENLQSLCNPCHAR